MRAVGFRANGGFEVLEELDLPEPLPAYLPAFGGYAETVTADTRFVGSLRTETGEADPAGAAGLPCVYPTAFGVLKDAGRLREGEDVLIHSAAGVWSGWPR